MTYASSRFLSVFSIGIAGAVLAVGAFTLGPAAERWLGFGVGVGTLVVLAGAFAVAGRGTLQRVIDAFLAPVCAWAAVSALTIEPHGAGLTKWLGFAAGAAIGTLGGISLLAHEIALESDLRWASERIWVVPDHQEERDALSRPAG